MTTTVFVRNQSTDVPETYQAGLLIDLFDEHARSTVATNIERLLRCLGYPAQNLVDFCLLAIAVYVADKKTLRATQPDGWTRRFVVNLPVQDIALWNSLKPAICSTLSFLMGDYWDIDFREGINLLKAVTQPLRLYKHADAVCLFSGGLDSTVGTIDLLHKGASLALVGHYENHRINKVQRDIVERIKTHYNTQIFQHIQLSMGPAGRRRRQQYPLPPQMELSNRSRSLLFLALGLVAANAISETTPLYMPENGFISLNIPLSRARGGSCSTRTTHPFYLQQIREILTKLGCQTPVLNPYRLSTKGEMVDGCANRPLVKSVAPATISCSHPTAGRFERLPFGNCGYCLPCIVRRSAMHRVGIVDKYNYDICTDVNWVTRSKKGQDVRAVFRGLQSSEQVTISDLLSTGPILGGYDEIQNLLGVYNRGMAEMRQLFLDQASDPVKRFASL